MNPTEIVITGFVLVAIVIASYQVYLDEKHEWNGGVSLYSGMPWKQFDTDSQGGMMFKDGEGHYCCISWTHITKDMRNVQ